MDRTEFPAGRSIPAALGVLIAEVGAQRHALSAVADAKPAPECEYYRDVAGRLAGAVENLRLARAALESADADLQKLMAEKIGGGGVAHGAERVSGGADTGGAGLGGA